MKFIKSFKLVDSNREGDAFSFSKLHNILVNTYPLHIFPEKDLENIEFDNITIFYGNNGSGKSTLLNIIADKINAQRKNNISKGSMFDSYVSMCDYEMSLELPMDIKIITSDDIFDYLINIRNINSHVNSRKELLSNEYLSFKNSDSYDSLDNYEMLKKSVDAKRRSMTNYVRERLGNNNIVEQSNGESALLFWEKEIGENGLYILDEPENSLSAENQIKLKKFIEDSARFFNCQFIISTHSPFLLSLNEARIYDLDSYPVTVKKWTELSNVRVYYNFFKENEDSFK